MFIEVYQIPMENWSKPSLQSADPENRRLIPLHAISRVRPSQQCAGRAELQLGKDKVIMIVGTYDEVVERVANAVTLGKVCRIK
jgi:hypothetical protein